MIIKNGLVFSENFDFEEKNIYIENGLISHSESDNEEIDATGLYVIPGLIDIHTHGAVGHDFCDAELDGLYKIAEFERDNGITSFCPTSMTLPEERLSEIFSIIKDYEEAPTRARVLGINMEGPFIAASKKGAQNANYIINSDIEMFKRLNEISGSKIKLVTIAPETTDAMPFIRELSDSVSISLGHSNADYSVADTAFKDGANHVTHLFNAMPAFNHRDPGIVGASLENTNVMVELICDKIHIHPCMVRSTFKLFGEDRIILISDSMEATGMEDGTYSLGGQSVTKSGNKATLSDGTIAGSVTNLFTCFRNAVDLGIPLKSAIKMATYNPAKSIGMSDKVGIIKEGAYADLLLLDKELNLIRVIKTS